MMQGHNSTISYNKYGYESEWGQNRVSKVNIFSLNFCLSILKIVSFKNGQKQHFDCSELTATLVIGNM